MTLQETISITNSFVPAAVAVGIVLFALLGIKELLEEAKVAIQKRA
tara:strand:+ start:2224 stop:2361 length:138 start_codon:yes stop_codon:yes gene_type:complete